MVCVPSLRFYLTLNHMKIAIHISSDTSDLNHISIQSKLEQPYEVSSPQRIKKCRFITLINQSNVKDIENSLFDLFS